MKSQRIERTPGVGSARSARWTASFWLLVAVATFTGLAGCDRQPPTTNAPAASPPQQFTNARFEQLDLRLNEGILNAVVANDSGFGRLLLTYPGSSQVQYINLTVGQSWVVQNVPLVSVLGPGVEHTVAIVFGLGVQAGTPVSEIKYGLSVTTNTVQDAPTATETATVNDGLVVFSDGEPGAGPTNPQGPQAPLVGDAVVDDTPHTNDKDFPNQESRKLFCVPVAISNSLKWLKISQNIPDDQLPPEDTEIEGWAERFGTTEGSGTTDPTWPQKKADYFARKGIPIDTTFIPPGDVNKVGDLLDKDCDVELRGRSHTASIVGLVRTKDGKYTITIRHDTKQGEMNGTVDEIVIYDPATGKISGDVWLDGKDIRGFVVECYRKPEAPKKD